MDDEAVLPEALDEGDMVRQRGGWTQVTGQKPAERRGGAHPGV